MIPTHSFRLLELILYQTRDIICIATVSPVAAPMKVMQPDLQQTEHGSVLIKNGSVVPVLESP